MSTGQSDIASLTAEDLAILSRQPHALQIIQKWADKKAFERIRANYFASDDPRDWVDARGL